MAMVAQASNPSYSEGRDGEHDSPKPAQAKSSQDPISTNKNMGMVVHACHPNYTGSVNRGESWSSLGIK
jgi:hypothetical protein